MKLDKIERTLRTADLSVLDFKHVREYKSIFLSGLHWLTKCEPGVATVDLRADVDFNPEFDIRFFTKNKEDRSQIVDMHGASSTNRLELRVNDQDIFFIFRDLSSTCGKHRLSFDWLSKVRNMENIETSLDEALNLKNTSFVKEGRFFIVPRKA